MQQQLDLGEEEQFRVKFVKNVWFGFVSPLCDSVSTKTEKSNIDFDWFINHCEREVEETEGLQARSESTWAGIPAPPAPTWAQALHRFNQNNNKLGIASSMW